MFTGCSGCSAFCSAGYSDCSADYSGYSGYSDSSADFCFDCSSEYLLDFCVYRCAIFPPISVFILRFKNQTNK